MLLAASAQVAQAQEQRQEQPHEQPVPACLSQHTLGQELRREGKLIESRHALELCSAAQCPSVVIRDCLEWMEQVQKQIPSLGFRVMADGAARADARVYLDGNIVLDELSGKAIELNPGAHVVRVELPPFEPFEEQVLVIEGDKFRMLEINFATPASNLPSKAPLAAAPAPTPAPELERPTPLASYVFTGVGAAAAISGAAWGLSMLSLRKDLERVCAPNCKERDVDVLRQRALLADISWGVSAASLVTAVALYIFRPEKVVERSVAFDLQISPSGGAYGSLSISTF